jgi:hypothetical protein
MRYILAVLLLSLVFSANAGQEAGGGGHGFILSDGSIVLSDSYVRVESDKNQIYLPPRLVRELHNVKKYFDAYLTKNFKMEEFFGEHVLDPSIKYYLVKAKDMPKSRLCRSPGYEYKPEGSKHIRIGCTLGNKTYLLDTVIEQMNIANLVALVIHERLQAYLTRGIHFNTDDEKYRIIRTISKGILALYDVYKTQETNQASRLSSGQFADLQGLAIELEGLFGDKGSMYSLQVHQNGGGAYSRCALFSEHNEVSEDAFIGLGVSLKAADNNSSSNQCRLSLNLSEGSIIKKSDIVVYGTGLTVRLAKNAKLIASSITLYPNSTAYHFDANSHISIGENSLIETTVIWTERLIVLGNSQIQDSYIAPEVKGIRDTRLDSQLDISGNVKLTKFYSKARNLSIGDGSVITNSSFTDFESGNCTFSTGKSVTITNSNLGCLQNSLNPGALGLDVVLLGNSIFENINGNFVSLHPTFRENHLLGKRAVLKGEFRLSEGAYVCGHEGDTTILMLINKKDEVNTIEDLINNCEVQ